MQQTRRLSLQLPTAGVQKGGAHWHRLGILNHIKNKQRIACSSHRGHEAALLGVGQRLSHEQAVQCVQLTRSCVWQVSYNGGAHWHSLGKPKKFTYQQCDTCTSVAQDEPWRCQLHLHGPSSWAAGEGVLQDQPAAK